MLEALNLRSRGLCLHATEIIFSTPYHRANYETARECPARAAEALVSQMQRRELVSCRELSFELAVAGRSLSMRMIPTPS